MAFNLNKLVQPECGAPNPLVSVAQQIAMRPPTPAHSSRYRQRQASINFAKEFIDQKVTPTNVGPTTSELSGGHQQIVKNIDSHHHRNLFGYMAGLNLNSGMAQPVMQPQYSTKTTAGEQLETKYRNDMISQSSSNQRRMNETDKLDDVQFWQSLSQKYIGPTTYDNIKAAKAKSNLTKTSQVGDEQRGSEEKATEREDEEASTTSNRRLHTSSPSDMEYIFDERNPLKDQFEDPFTEGLKRLEQGDIPSAALLFEAAVQNDPENSAAWRYLGTTQAQNEKDGSAIRALRNCLRLDGNDQQARLAISVSLANETYQHEACKFLLGWLISHDRYKALGASLEEFYQLDNELSNDPFYMNAVDEKHYKYVRDKFVEAARMSPTNPDPEVQSSLGVLFNMRGEYEKAVDCFKAALSVKADDSLLWNRLGATLANGNKSDEAVLAYRKALEIAPGFLRSRYNLAISLIHLNTYDEAAKQLVQILNMQAAGRGSKNTQIRTRSITSTSIWNTLRTVATLMNRVELYPLIDGRNLPGCNKEFFKTNSGQSN